MNPETTIRLECLRLAANHGGVPEDIARRARVYADFILGADLPLSGTEVEWKHAS